jgi:hypothetical protein
MTAWLADEEDGEDKGEVHELRGLSVVELSLVPRGADRGSARGWLLLKSADHGGGKERSEMVEALSLEQTGRLESDLNTADPREEEVLAAVEKAAGGALSDAAKVAVRGAVRLLFSHRDEIGEDVIRALTALAGEQAAPARATGTELTGKAASGLAEIAKAAPGRRAELVKARQHEIEADPAAYEEHRAAVIAGYPPDRGQQIAKAATPAWDEVLRRADGLVAKSHDGMTAMAAVNAVLDSDASLAERYRNEHYSR